MSVYSFIKSQRGRDKVLSNGYIYTFRKETPNGTQYRCATRKCPGSIRIMFERCFEICIHNHPPSFEDTTIAQIKHDIKTRALETKERPSDIINKIVRGDKIVLAPLLPRL